ncbi:PLDc N-terminal domain-containing protein [Cohnella cholangitidis]|uniref:Transcriptional regulator n=1 Tax=Cohnella cholangitidis TaxID=2598458 RepID=A0A7G5BVP5_9BACL|nr:PLDc N-terminal domain-containing protein [Cohnella cholangitidis]QMV41029.1 transcriptional regulator [Cohnella cholangitidis]
MDKLDLLKILLPVVLIQLILLVTALTYLFRMDSVRGKKWVWVLVIVLVNIVGPILFFAFGRKER